MQASEMGQYKLFGTLIHGRIAVLVIQEKSVFSTLRIGSSVTIVGFVKL